MREETHTHIHTHFKNKFPGQWFSTDSMELPWGSRPCVVCFPPLPERLLVCIPIGFFIRNPLKKGFAANKNDFNPIN
jgi:hypothetical protein